MGIEIRIIDVLEDVKSAVDKSICGLIVQYPDTEGVLKDYSKVVEAAHQAGVSLAFCFYLSVISNSLFLSLGIGSHVDRFVSMRLNQTARRIRRRYSSWIGSAVRCSNGIWWAACGLLWSFE